MRETAITKLSSVKEVHAYLGLPAPLNPLLTFIDHAQTQPGIEQPSQKLLIGLYNISIKRSFKGKLKYGKHHYDFDSGTMSFIAPNQVMSVDKEEDRNQDGWSLMFHADLIRQYPLGKAIANYGYFSYEVNEALHLSDEEEKTIEGIIRQIQNEIHARLDHFSQDVIVSNLELLLSYCNRFYSRQFITRKMATSDLLSQFETVLNSYFGADADVQIPTVEKLATDLHVSASYLSDMLRSLTGQNTQQHIHEKLIEKAKGLLSTTNNTVSEIAYQLGFEYTQSFSKLFKNKTKLTPLEFRRLFN